MSSAPEPVILVRQSGMTTAQDPTVDLRPYKLDQPALRSRRWRQRGQLAGGLKGDDVRTDSPDGRTAMATSYVAAYAGSALKTPTQMPGHSAPSPLRAMPFGPRRF